MTTIKAIYEHGVFRPTEPVLLAEGTAVDLVLPEADQGDPNPASVAAELAKIAALAPRTGQIDTAGRDHDKILYGGEDAR